MSSENIVSKKFRILIDKSQRLYERISFWTRASDVEFNSGKNAQDTLGNIYGISDSLTSTSSNIAASTAAIKAINDKITGINLGNATQADVLTGKKFSSQAGLNKIGTMANLNGAVGYGTIQDGTTFARIFLNNTGKITQGSSYVDVSCDVLKNNVDALNSNLGGKYFLVNNSMIKSNIINNFIGKSIALIGGYPAYTGSANSGIKQNYYIIVCDDSRGTTYVSEKAVDVTNKTALCISGRLSFGTSAQIKIGLSKTANPSSLSDFVKTYTCNSATENVHFDVSDINGEYYLCFALYLNCHYRIDSIVLV